MVIAIALSTKKKVKTADQLILIQNITGNDYHKLVISCVITDLFKVYSIHKTL